MEEKRGEVAWNIVAEQTKFVGELLQKATSFYLAGNIRQWFNTLTAIRENIDYDLKDNESEELNKIEVKCWSLQKYWSKYVKLLHEGRNSKENLLSKKKDYVDNVRDYSRRLLKILNSLGYFPKKEDRTKLSF